ncbi:MAG: acetyl-CoA C-acetyltransferase [Cognaticolwellia sp.]|jgi:acetyl-CoA C-acetyltransferase
MSEAYIYDAVRTPRGRGKPSGALHLATPVHLASTLLNAIKARNPGLDPHRVDDVVLGTVEPHSEQGGALARTAVLATGFGEGVPGVQLNRYCGSGLEAVNQAAARIRSGWEDWIIAGGVESMSRVPMASGGDPWAMDPDTNYATGFVPQGIGADLIATIEGFTREDVDGFGVRSQALAAAAWQEGRFGKSIIPVCDAYGLPLLDRAWAPKGALMPWRCKSTHGYSASSMCTTRATPRES